MQDVHTKNKLVAMFVLEKLAMPIQEDVFCDMCCYDNNWIETPLFAKQVILDLETSGFVRREPNTTTGGYMISLTDDGVTCLGHFFKDILQSVRDDITLCISRNRHNYQKKQELFSDYYKNPDNSYTVVLKIIEIDKTLMELKFNVSSRAAAAKLYNSWSDKAIDTYKLLYEQLID